MVHGSTLPRSAQSRTQAQLVRFILVTLALGWIIVDGVRNLQLAFREILTGLLLQVALLGNFQVVLIVRNKVVRLVQSLLNVGGVPITSVTFREIFLRQRAMHQQVQGERVVQQIWGWFLVL